jgi:hypothetical protein
VTVYRHEDGSVRFWDVSSVHISLMYKLSTADMFGGYSGRDGLDVDGDEEWPPFRKVGDDSILFLMLVSSSWL